MRPFLNHPLRLGFRSLWLAVELVRAALDYLLWVLVRSAEPVTAARVQWLQRSCRRVLRVFNVELQVEGPIPLTGLLVCNHLSYLDILVLGALAPAVFVAKKEVKSWPIFGWFAVLAGTVFVNRCSRSQTGRAAQQVDSVLGNGMLLVLFPEGTSSDGQDVLPFKSSLLEPAVSGTRPLSACFLHYRIDDGDVGEEVCYWRDMTFLPHLVNLLTKSRIFACIRLSKVPQLTNCRKALARHLHSEVSRLGKAGGWRADLRVVNL
jgi:lyso-ornithine lipid O-acyltransferase